jgi:hypothetical protein
VTVTRLVGRLVSISIAEILRKESKPIRIIETRCVRLPEMITNEKSYLHCLHDDEVYKLLTTKIPRGVSS